MYREKGVGMRMRQTGLAIVAVLLFCGGCRSLKKALNDDYAASQKNREQRTALIGEDIFPGAHSSSVAPSRVRKGLSSSEQALFDEAMESGRGRARTPSELRDSEDKEMSDWIFGGR